MNSYPELKWVVECKPGKQVFYEAIAAFNSKVVAEDYANDCENVNGVWATYRVVEVK